METQFWALFTICMTFGWVVTTWIRAKHGYPVEDTFGGHVKPIKSIEIEGLKRQVEKDLAERDKTIADLRERIQVLEQIVTDRDGRLNDELARLNA
jgi:hypothetical protein